MFQSLDLSCGKRFTVIVLMKSLGKRVWLLNPYSFMMRWPEHAHVQPGTTSWGPQSHIHPAAVVSGLWIRETTELPELAEGPSEP